MEEENEEKGYLLCYQGMDVYLPRESGHAAAKRILRIFFGFSPSQV
jgi:hypothetical protein